MGLDEILRVNAELYGEREAIVQGHRRLTWSDLWQRTVRLASALRDMGVGTGDRGAIIMSNCPEYIEALVALQAVDAVPVPVNTRLAPSEMAELMGQCDVSLAFADSESMEMAEKVEGLLPGDMKAWIAVGHWPPTGWRSYEALLSRASDVLPEVPRRERIGVVFPTAGTTGRPKCAVLTHEVLDAVLEMVPSYSAEVMELAPQTGFLPGHVRFFIPAPIYHVAGFMPTITQVAMKNTLVFPSSRRFDPQEACEIIQAEGVTACFMVPTMYRRLLEFPRLDEYDLRSVSLLCTGAARMPLGLKRALLERFPWAALIDGYGSTETAGGVCLSVTTSADIERVEEGFIGRPYPEVRVRIVDEAGRDVPPGEVGELVVRSPAMFVEYYGDPERTSGVLRDGWYHTGDLCRMDEEGNIYYVERKDQMIITGGEKVYPVEVEEVLRSHPKVAEAAVLGVPDEEWGEVVKAVVQLRPREEATEEELREFCRERMASFKVPKVVQLVDEVPLTEDGKVHRIKVKEAFGGV